MNKELDVLKKIGLEDREARIYFSLLSLGSSTATKISEVVGVERTTTYDLLNKLISRGIVSFVIKDKKRYFSPINPHKLLKELQENEVALREVMPNLINLMESEKEQSSVEVLKGKESVLSILNMVLHDKKDYLFMGAAHEACELFPIAAYKFAKEAAELSLSGKLICEEGFGNSEVDVIGKNESYKLISKKFTSTTTQVWGNKTAFFIYKDPIYAILIESKEIADRHRLYFDYLWKLAKEPTKEHKKKTLIK